MQRCGEGGGGRGAGTRGAGLKMDFLLKWITHQPTWIKAIFVFGLGVGIVFWFAKPEEQIAVPIQAPKFQNWVNVPVNVSVPVAPNNVSTSAPQDAGETQSRDQHRNHLPQSMDRSSSAPQNAATQANVTSINQSGGVTAQSVGEVNIGRSQ